MRTQEDDLVSVIIS